MTKEVRCTSPYCIVQDGVRGRLFTPPEDAQAIANVWCPTCIKLGSQMEFFAKQTASMIRGVYNGYAETALPDDTKIFLQAYTNEILKQLGEEL